MTDSKKPNKKDTKTNKQALIDFIKQNDSYYSTDQNLDWFTEAELNIIKQAIELKLRKSN